MHYKYYITIITVALWVSIQPFINKIIYHLSNQKLSIYTTSILSILIRLLWDLYFLMSSKHTSTPDVHKSTWVNYVYYMIFIITVFSQTMIDNIANNKIDHYLFKEKNNTSYSYIQALVILITYLLTQINHLKRYDIIGYITIIIGIVIVIF